MNQTIVFSLVILFLTRLVGFIINFDFFLKTKQFKFKMASIGWLIWALAALLPLFTYINLIADFLLFYNIFGTFISMTFLGFSLTSYFLPNMKKYLIYVNTFIFILSHLVFFLLGINLIISILGVGFNILWFLIILSPLIRWNNFKTKVDKAIWYWFFLILGFSLLYIPIAITQILNGYSYGLYNLNEPIIISFNYGYAIVITLLIIVLVIHIEYKVSEDQKNDLKDKYSHDLGNVLQAVNTSIELLDYPEAKGSERDDLRDMLWKKLQEAAELIKDIREI